MSKPKVEPVEDIVKTDEAASYWIENAAYFLRESEILVLNVLSANEICMRLKNCDFSVRIIHRNLF
jgi:hypothetical protein